MSGPSCGLSSVYADFRRGGVGLGCSKALAAFSWFGHFSVDPVVRFFSVAEGRRQRTDLYRAISGNLHFCGTAIPTSTPVCSPCYFHLVVRAGSGVSRLVADVKSGGPREF